GWFPGLARTSALRAADVGPGRTGGSHFRAIRAKTMGDARHRLRGRDVAGTDPFATRCRLWLCRNHSALRDRMDHGRVRLFRRPRGRWPEADADYQPEENLVWRYRRYGRCHDRWNARRRSVRVVQHDCIASGHIRTFGLGAIWGFV